MKKPAKTIPNEKTLRNVEKYFEYSKKSIILIKIIRYLRNSLTKTIMLYMEEIVINAMATIQRDTKTLTQNKASAD